MAIDPVCKMKVEESKAAATSEYVEYMLLVRRLGKQLYF